jgi:hypothetical protein
MEAFFYVKCHFVIVMLSVVMMNVFMQMVVAPFLTFERLYSNKLKQHILRSFEHTLRLIYIRDVFLQNHTGDRGLLQYGISYSRKKFYSTITMSESRINGSSKLQCFVAARHSHPS